MRGKSQEVVPWSPEDWTALVQSGTNHIYQPGDHLLRQGDPGSWVIALIRGRVRVVYTAAPGSEILLAIRGPGDLLGEFGHGDGELRSASAVALERCLGSVVPDSQFTAWATQRRTHPQLNRYILAKARESAEVTWRLSRCRPSQRLASLVLAVVEADRGRSPDASRVPMSQDELARAVGLARSSVTPVLADWKRRGVVSISRAHMTVVDFAALQREV